MLELVKVLQDPVTCEGLTLKDDYILNEASGKNYRIEEEVIRFVDNGEIEGNNKKYLELYDKIAPFYNLANKLYFIFKFGGEKNYRKEFLSELEIKDNDKVIEISVGTGDNFPFLPKNIDLYGLDISWGMLKQARKHLRRWKLDVFLVQARAENLPFKDETFDVVYHVGGINYFNNRAKAVKEMIRIAKGGSKIIIVDETEKLVKETYRKNPVTRKYYKEEEDISDLINLIPGNMLEIEYKEICKGLMYCISFRKPK